MTAFKRLDLNDTPAENDEEAEALAEEFIDAAPDDVLTASEYTWQFREMSVEYLVEHALAGLDQAAEHARNIRLDPALSNLERPVVVSLREEIGDGRDHTRSDLRLWDGVHRILSAWMLGVPTLQAAVGFPAGDFECCEKLRGGRMLRP
jgi:hypothetical protein